MIDNYFTGGIFVHKRNETRSPDGGVAVTYAEGVEILGRIRFLSGSDRIMGDKDTYISDHRLYCGTSVGVSEGDRVEFSGKEYDVVAVNNVMNMGGHLQVELKKR